MLISCYVTLGEKSTGSTPLQSNATTVLNLLESSAVYGFMVSLRMSGNKMSFFKGCNVHGFLGQFTTKKCQIKFVYSDLATCDLVHKLETVYGLWKYFLKHTWRLYMTSGNNF